MKGRKPKKGLLTENEFFNATDLDEAARKKCEAEGLLKPEMGSDGQRFYSPDDVELGKELGTAVKKCTDVGLPRGDAHEMVIQGVPSKKRRSGKAGDDPQKTIDPRKIKTHPTFEDLLAIDEDLLKSITADMAANGYYESKPVVLATWPGQDAPVLIDGHTRVRGSIDARIARVFFIVEVFDDEAAALQHAMNLQTKRRTTDDRVRFRLIERFDSLMERGGDRRSQQAKSKPPRGGIETRRTTSAAKTAALVGCGTRTVERVRRIKSEGTPEILESVRNGELKITQAEKAIIEKAKEGKNKGAEPPVAENENPMVQITDKNLSALRQLEGTLHEHVNKAVKMYIRWLRDKGRFPEKK